MPLLGASQEVAKKDAKGSAFGNRLCAQKLLMLRVTNVFAKG
jgi:hypothetical protein